MAGATPDRQRGLILARRAVELSRGEDSASLDALAAAFAALGRWDEAITTARDALAKSQVHGSGNGAAAAESAEAEKRAREARLARYEHHELPALP